MFVDQKILKKRALPYNLEKSAPATFKINRSGIEKNHSSVFNFLLNNISEFDHHLFIISRSQISDYMSCFQLFKDFFGSRLLLLIQKFSIAKSHDSLMRKKLQFNVFIANILPN